MKKIKIRGAPVLAVRLAAAQARRLEAATEASKGPRRTVRAMGLPLPKKIAADVLPFPPNITELSHGQVRNLMSYYTAFYGYANSQLGMWKGKHAILSRILQSRKSILFQQYKPEKKTSDWSEAIQGRIQKNKEIKKLEALSVEAEAMVAVLDTLVWTYMKFADVASREISARANEMERDFRSGQPKRRHTSD